MGEREAKAAGLARAADPEAFRSIVEANSQKLFRLAFRMVQNEQDAEDVVQDTFLRAYRQFERFESRSQIGTWLYRIAINRSLDLLRDRRKAPALLDLDSQSEGRDGALPSLAETIATGAPSPERLRFSSEMKHGIEAAMGRLTDSERAAFVLRHYESKGIEEIGAILGLRTNATKNSIFRAVQKLRRELEPLLRPMQTGPREYARESEPGGGGRE